jgi:DNA-binding CsgD family transcriptional regulator
MTVLREISRGLTDKEIALALQISLSRVQKVKAELRARLHARTTAHIIALTRPRHRQAA